MILLFYLLQVNAYIFFKCLATVDCSTLRTTDVDTVKNCWVGYVIAILWRELLFVLFSASLKIAGSGAVVVGVAAMNGFCCISLSVIRTSCCILSKLLPLPKFLMDLTRSDISAIILSACVMVGHLIYCGWSVLYLWIACFWWFLCGTDAYDSVQVMFLNTNRPLNDIPMYLVCLYFHALALTCPLVLAAFCYNQIFRSYELIMKCWALH